MKAGKNRFKELVAQAFDELPEEFRRRMENVDIVVEDVPPPDYNRPGTMVLGLYQGVPLKHRGGWYGNVLPDKISIYRRPIESTCRNEEDLVKQIKDVVLHEIGHHFGMSEKDLR